MLDVLLLPFVVDVLVPLFPGGGGGGSPLPGPSANTGAAAKLSAASKIKDRRNFFMEISLSRGSEGCSFAELPSDARFPQTFVARAKELLHPPDAASPEGPRASRSVCCNSFPSPRFPDVRDPMHGRSAFGQSPTRAKRWHKMALRPREKRGSGCEMQAYRARSCFRSQGALLAGCYQTRQLFTGAIG